MAANRMIQTGGPPAARGLVIRVLLERFRSLKLSCECNSVQPSLLSVTTGEFFVERIHWLTRLSPSVIPTSVTWRLTHSTVEFRTCVRRWFNKVFRKTHHRIASRVIQCISIFTLYLFTIHFKILHLPFIVFQTHSQILITMLTASSEGISEKKLNLHNTGLPQISVVYNYRSIRVFCYVQSPLTLTAPLM
jgi:hypothetical protein